MNDFTNIADMPRNKMLSVAFTEKIAHIEAIAGVKSVDIDDNNGGSFQVAVVLDMQHFGGEWDWTNAYGFSDAKKAKMLPRVVQAVKNAFRKIEGATVTGHNSPQMRYRYWRDEFQARPKAHRQGYNTPVLMIDVHWYPENERINI